MSYTNNERVIFKDNKNGYVVTISSLKELNEDLKGSRIIIKRLVGGQVISGNLYYGWFRDTDQASQLFDRICNVLESNKDNFDGNFWNFYTHPIRYLIKHRN